MRRIMGILVLFAVSLGTPYASAVGEAVTVDSFEYDGIREIRLKNGSFFDVVINGSSRTAVTGQVVMPEENLDRYRVVHEKRGSVLEIGLEKNVINIGTTGKNEIVLEVPTETLLDIVTSSGDQVVEGIESGRVVLKASSGDITVSTIRADLSITVSSGRIEMQEITGGITVRSSSGEISLRDGTGNVSAEASSGKISLSEVKGDITARSSSGDQRYENVTGSIAARSSSGKITTREQSGSLDLKATSGDLKGESVRLTGDSSFETSSGKIEFDFANPIEELSFDLSASSGSLRAGESRGGNRLVLQGGGGTRIVGKSSSGDQTYR